MTSNEIAWLSTREAADLLGITVRTLYRLIDSGQVPAYRLGRVIRLQEAEVREFITHSRIEPGSLEHLYVDATSEEAAVVPDDAEVADSEAADTHGAPIAAVAFPPPSTAD